MIIDIQNSNYVVESNVSLEEAMQAITANHRGAVVVVDEKRHVIGIVSDGDVRRALLRGAMMKTPVMQAVNYSVISLSRKDVKSPHAAEEALTKHPNVNVIPVVDEKNILVDLVIRGGAHS